MLKQVGSLALVLSLSAVVCPGAPRPRLPRQAREEGALEQGIALLARRQFNEALAAFNRFKQTHPLDARPYFYAGLSLAEAGNLSAAALELNEAVRLDSRRPEYLVFQASLYARLKQRSHAEDLLAIIQREGIAERLDASWVWLLSEACYRMERFDDVLRALDLLEKLKPEDPRLDLNRGQVYAVQSRFDPALDAFRKSIAKHPGNSLAHFELGKLLYQGGDLPAAKNALLEAVRLDKNNPQYLQKLGALCLALKEIDEAIAHLERAAALDSNSAQVYYSLGQAWQRKGERAKAAEFGKKFQKLKRGEEEREEVERLLARGERMLDEGKDDEARSLFAQVVQADPGNWTAHGYLAEMFLAAGDRQNARPHLTKMEALDADSVVGAWLLARYWAGERQFEKARGYAERVRLVRPGHAPLRHLLGNIYLELNQPEKALPEFEAAVNLAPDRADFRADLRRLEQRKRQQQ
ncbi:MAG: tetratricopeptide repeat protein [Blastocatellia bacterium]